MTSSGIGEGSESPYEVSRAGDISSMVEVVEDISICGRVWRLPQVVEHSPRWEGAYDYFRAETFGSVVIWLPILSSPYT